MRCCLQLKIRKKKKRKTKSEDQAEDVFAPLVERLRSSFNKDDQFAIFGKNVAAKLKVLPKETRLYTEKLINDLLFQAEMGNITKNTRIISLADDSRKPNNFQNHDAACVYYPNQPNYNLAHHHQQHQEQNYLLNSNVSGRIHEMQNFLPSTSLQPQGLEINSQENNGGSSITTSTFFRQYNPLTEDN